MTMPTVRLPLGRCPSLRMMGIGVCRPEGPSRWCLPNLWCLHLYTYHADLVFDGQPLVIRPGMVGITPAGTDVQYRFRGTSEHVFAHFLPNGPAQTIEVPVLQDLGQRFGQMHRALIDPDHWATTAPIRSEVRLWDVLWQVADGDARYEGHPALTRARQLIEAGLGGQLFVASIANNVGISHNQLTRLFRQHLGCSVAGYIRSQRVARAEHFLRHSTMPLHTIAELIGVSNLQHFNKLIRNGLGRSPREVRSGK